MRNYRLVYFHNQHVETTPVTFSECSSTRMSDGCLLFPLIVFALCLFSLQLFAQQPASVHKEIIPKGLHKAWDDFVRAVIAGDEKTLRAGSASCVYCTDCLENTAAEDSAQTRLQETHPSSWYHLKYGKQCYIPIEKFISNDLPIIFDKETISRFTDSTKVLFHNNSINKHLYEKSCIVRRGERHDATCYEVLVSIIDPSSASEGLQKAFEFMCVGKRYIFCGYSTIP